LPASGSTGNVRRTERIIFDFLGWNLLVYKTLQALCWSKGQLEPLTGGGGREKGSGRDVMGVTGLLHTKASSKNLILDIKR
jgi:hypothetical protein